MKKSIILFVITFSFATIISCATALTPEGQRVHLVIKHEAPSNCELINDISTGFSGEPSVIGVKNSLRNETAELGGNYVVIDTIEAHTSQDGTLYKGSGRAYRCPLSK